MSSLSGLGGEQETQRREGGRTGDNSSAKISFFEGSTVELQAGTEIEIASLDISEDTDSATIILEQTIGSIIFRVMKVIDPASRYEIETPNGVVAVRGSAVQVTVSEDDTTWVCNLEGDIWVIAQGVELQIPEGECCVIRPGEPPELTDMHTITFAVAGPMTESQGEHQWWGAELARDEINAGAGVNVGGVYHTIELVQVDTNEISGTPEEGVTALEAVIEDVDFALGGYWTDEVMVYREVAMDAKKIFMDCGAASGVLQYSVVEDYDRYKYWFKTSPYNGAFVVRAWLKMTGTVGIVLRQILKGYGDAVGEDYRVPVDGKLRVHILGDYDYAPWWEGQVAAAQTYLPLAGFTVTGTTLVSPTASNITSELLAIAATKPHIIFTAFAGPVSDVYSMQKAELGIPAMTIGLNVEGGMKAHWANTDGKCNGEIQLDTSAEGLQNTARTAAFFDAFVAKTGTYPYYPAGTYNAIYQLKEAIEAVSLLLLHRHGWYACLLSYAGGHYQCNTARTVCPQRGSGTLIV